MSSIVEIADNLKSIEERVQSHVEYLERAKLEISDTMNKAQEQFGKDRNGQDAVMSMSRALNELSGVDGILYALKSGINEYMGNLRK